MSSNHQDDDDFVGDRTTIFSIHANQAILKPANAPNVHKKNKLPSKQSNVVVFFSAKGGSGATSLAVNTADHICRDKHRTCLLDLDIQLGDVLPSLNLKTQFTLAQGIALFKENSVLPAGHFIASKSGIYILSQAGSVDDVEQISPEWIAKIIEHLRTSFDAIIVDGVRDFSDNVLSVLDIANQVVLVVVQEVLAVRRARWIIKIMEQIGFDLKNITILVNRYHEQSEIPLASIEKFFVGMHIVLIPDDQHLMTYCLNHGMTLYDHRPDSRLNRYVGVLAKKIMNESYDDFSKNNTIIIQKSLKHKIAFWKK